MYLDRNENVSLILTKGTLVYPGLQAKGFRDL